MFFTEEKILEKEYKVGNNVEKFMNPIDFQRFWGMRNWRWTIWRIQIWPYKFYEKYNLAK